MQSQTGKAASIRCPRCGYDQRGVMATWTEQCPLEGTCSECGFDWHWAELLNPNLSLPAWCIEFVPVLSIPRAAPRTLMRVFAPLRFWRLLKLRHPVRPSRLMVYLVILLALTYLLFLSGQAWLTWKEYQDAKAPRWATVSATGTLVVQSSPNPPSAWEVVGRAVVFPLSTQWSRPLGTFAGGLNVSVVPPPRLIARRWMVESSMACGYAATALIAMAASLMTLPITLRAAKVRWAHILRVTLYGMTFVVAVIWLQMLNDAFGVGFISLRSLLLVWFPLVCFVWWFAACRHYWRVRHDFGVALAMVIIGTGANFAAWLYLTKVFPRVVLHWWID